jgi:hypothetical protein
VTDDVACSLDACKHQYCFACIHEWVDKSENKCPQCKVAIHKLTYKDIKGKTTYKDITDKDQREDPDSEYDDESDYDSEEDLALAIAAFTRLGRLQI